MIAASKTGLGRHRVLLRPVIPDHNAASSGSFHMVPADPNSAAPLPSGGSDPRTRAAPSAAPRIREYELLEQIGQGGMGTVFKASHTMLERMVAIKLLPRERMHHAESVARFRREMKAVGKLVHPNIVQAHDAGEEAGVHFWRAFSGDGIRRWRRRLARSKALWTAPRSRCLRDHPPSRRRFAARPRTSHGPPRHQAEQSAPL